MRTAEFERRQNEVISQSNQTENGAMILDDRLGVEEKDEEHWEEEYVVLDLDDVFRGASIPNFAYTLSGLDTLNPILTLDNGLKLIGQYMETIGSVVVYSEKEEDVFEAQADTQELPTPADPFAAHPVKKLLKRVRGVCKLERKLKFCAMPIADAPAKNGTFTQSAPVQNAKPGGNASHVNDMPVEDASLHKTAPTEDALLENARPTEGASLEYIMPSEDAPIDNAKATENAALDTATATEDAAVQHATTTEDAPLNNTRAMEGAPLEHATATEVSSPKIVTETEDASLEITRPTEDASLENATRTES